MNIQGNSRYHEIHARSLRDPEGFWGEAARDIDWIEPARKIFDPSQGLYGRWFTGAVVNSCYNALDRHVAGGRADQLALIHDSPLSGSQTRLTYAELLNEVKTLAAIMADFGVAKGDRGRDRQNFRGGGALRARTARPGFTQSGESKAHSNAGQALRADVRKYRAQRNRPGNFRPGRSETHDIRYLARCLYRRPMVSRRRQMETAMDNRAGYGSAGQKRESLTRRRATINSFATIDVSSRCEYFAV